MNYYIIDGQYATVKRPLICGEKIADMLIDEGYTVVTADRYLELLEELEIIDGRD